MSTRNIFRPAMFPAAAILAAQLAVTGCGGEAKIGTDRSRDVRCETGTARLATVPRQVTATGSLEAAKTVTVSTRMMGWVKRLHVDEGQAVAKGDPLVNIDDTDLRAKQRQARAGIAEAQAVLANAEKMAERFTNLYAEKSVSRQQLDDVLTGRDRAAAGLKMAEAGLAEVNVHLSYLEITAPSPGVVARTMIEEGDMANPGMPLLVLEQSASMKVVAHVGEKDVARIAPGAMVTVDVTSLPGAKFTTPLDRIITAANPGSRTYDIEATIDNAEGRLRSGMFARVSVPVGERQAVLVPASAVQPRGQLNGVWVVDSDGIVHLRWIRLGHRHGDDHEVLAGLTGDETVVLSAATPLAEGDKVVK